MIKSLVPYQFKLRYQLTKRAFKDVMNGQVYSYAKPIKSNYSFKNEIPLKQKLTPNEGKKRNFQIAIQSIESVVIKPTEIFSFWKVVGNPSKKNGFKESRSLVNGQLKKSTGGGLCQLAGLMNYVSLHADLKIVERHNHSVDIYTEETRYTPLGTDATVAYGYKDFKVRNTLKNPIKFAFDMGNDSITVKLLHSDKILSSSISFNQKLNDHKKTKVETLVNDELKYSSTYLKLEAEV